MSDDQFTKLFKYIEAFRKEMRGELASIETKFDGKFDQLFGLVDAHEKRTETLEQERLFANHQLNLHENWIVRAAKAIQVKYSRS